MSSSRVGWLPFGGEHEVGAAFAQAVGELALDEQGVGGEGAAVEVEFEVVEQGEDRADPDPACGRRRAVAAAHPAEAARAPDARPVRGAVHRAAVARRVDEPFQEQQRMPEARRPVSGQARRSHSASAREPRFGPPPRQDQEPAVVGEQVLAVVLGAEVPADPAVARAALQRRHRKAEQRQLLAAPVRHIPQRLADLRQRAQEVVRPPSARGSALLSPAATGSTATSRSTTPPPDSVRTAPLPTPVRPGCPASELTPYLRWPSGGALRPDGSTTLRRKSKSLC